MMKWKEQSWADGGHTLVDICVWCVLTYGHRVERKLKCVCAYTSSVWGRSIALCKH